MKRAARLTSALLARKGFAMPASVVHFDHTAASTPDDAADKAVDNTRPDDNCSDDVRVIAAAVPDQPQGERPRPEQTPLPPLTAKPAAEGNQVRDFEKKLEKAFVMPHPDMRVGGFGRRRVPAGETGRRVAMTLRLDTDRHLKLRVLSAHAHQSCQQILTLALDNYLTEHCQDHGIKSCHCLQARVGNA